jgi:hypothetical protein
MQALRSRHGHGILRAEHALTPRPQGMPGTPSPAQQPSRGRSSSMVCSAGRMYHVA